MVIAVQSEATAWTSHLMCNGLPLRWNLRAPLRATLAAAAQLLGGLQPAHLLYDPALRRSLRNWLWSVGDSPLAPTSASGIQFTTHQVTLTLALTLTLTTLTLTHLRLGTPVHHAPGEGQG